MAGSGSISSSIAGRYATAIFGLCREENAIPKLEKDVAALSDAVAQSSDLRGFVTSPVYTRAEMGSAIRKVAEKIGVSSELSNALALMAENRRLFALPQLLTVLREMIDAEKGIVTAEVVSAKKLTKAQTSALAQALQAQLGKEAKFTASVDETLIGGMIVKVGSKMIDTSIRSKLATLENTMKEAG